MYEKLGGRHDKENVRPSSSKKLWIGKWKAQLTSYGCHATDTKQSLWTTNMTTKKRQHFVLQWKMEIRSVLQPCGGQRGGNNSPMPTKCVFAVVLKLHGPAFVSWNNLSSKGRAELIWCTVWKVVSCPEWDSSLCKIYPLKGDLIVRVTLRDTVTVSRRNQWRVKNIPVTRMPSLRAQYTLT